MESLQVGFALTTFIIMPSLIYLSVRLGRRLNWHRETMIGAGFGIVIFGYLPMMLATSEIYYWSIPHKGYLETSQEIYGLVHPFPIHAQKIYYVCHDCYENYECTVDEANFMEWTRREGFTVCRYNSDGTSDLLQVGKSYDYPPTEVHPATEDEKSQHKAKESNQKNSSHHQAGNHHGNGIIAHFQYDVSTQRLSYNAKKTYR